MRIFITLSALLFIVSGCSNPEPDGELTKDELRTAAANGKADDIFGGGDFCEAFGWYGDMECDDFCPAPDPDCGTCRLPGEECDPSECGTPPAPASRRCPDGTTIYGSVSCIDEGGACGWDFDAPECAPLDEGTACDPSSCDGPPPMPVSRPCHDGSVVYASVACEADSMGVCSWDAEIAECPACDPSECGTPPAPAARRCADGTMIYGSVSCIDEGGACGWDFDAPECPLLDEGTACDASLCAGPPPMPVSRPCHDGSVVYATVACEVDSMGVCSWGADIAECPACDPSECGTPPAPASRRCLDGTTIYGSVSCIDEGGVCGWDFDAPECPFVEPGTPCDPSLCREEPTFASRLCCDGTSAAPTAECVADGMGYDCEWVVAPAVCD